MNLFCRAKATKPGKGQSVKACFSSTGNMLQISDRKRESSRALNQSINNLYLESIQIYMNMYRNLEHIEALNINQLKNT